MDMYEFFLTPWFWLALTVIFSLIELASSFNLVTIWFALSSLVMILVSGFTEMLDAPLRFRLHIGIFLVLSLVLLLSTRPIVIKRLRAWKAKTNVDDLIGRDALVIKTISRFEKGEVKINSQIWTAVSETGEDIEENAECTVLGIDGVKAVVRRKYKS